MNCLFIKVTVTLCFMGNNNNNNLLHLYSAFLDTQSALHSKGAISSSTTNVQHPPGWCDGSHSAPERPPHTSLLVERRQSDEANQCIGMIRRPWWSEASGLVCQDAGVTPLLFFEGHPGIFNDHRESGPRFNVSSEGRLRDNVIYYCISINGDLLCFFLQDVILVSDVPRVCMWSFSSNYLTDNYL